MKEKLPYEKLIAEKMSELPVPDRENSWQQMKTLLDNTMPVSTMGKRVPGGKWWWMSGFAIIITMGTGLFFYLSTKRSVSETPAKNNMAEQLKADSFYHSNPSIDNTSTLQAKKNKHEAQLPSSSATALAEAADLANGITPGAAQQQNDSKSTKDIVIDNVVAESNNSESTQNKKTPAKLTAAEKTAVENNHNAPFPNKASLAVLKPLKLNGKNGGKNNFNSLQEELRRQVSYDRDRQENNGNKLTELAKNKQANISLYKNYMERSEDELLINFETEHANDDDPFKDISLQKVKGFDERSLIAYADENSTDIDVPASVRALPEVKFKRKMILRQMKRKERKEERELAKSYKSSPSFWGAKTDRWFAAGIAPYQNFAVGSQQNYNYSSSGNKGVASDYIPVPYLQLHVTNRVYVMSEFQFNSPQSTPNLLLSQKSITAPMNVAGCTEDIFLRKLYYFNMPVSFYYSPVKNFYVGSGLQFSSFNSGLAYVEQRSANNMLIHAETIKIKDDALASRIKSSEWRYLFDANYYADRFMFGFRYNRALNNYINLPESQARNQSFQFYVRYNIIVSSKKR